MIRSPLSALLASLAIAGGAAAQPAKPSLTAGPPCCAITGIDGRRAIVSAQEASTGHAFRFAVKDHEVLRGLTVGQKIWADFASGKVAVDPKGEPCCSIVNGNAAAPIALDPAGPSPCCTVTAIEPGTRLVTARINANGRTFRFEVSDPALLGALKPGHSIWASGEKREVGLRPGEVCCRIVGPLPAGMP